MRLALLKAPLPGLKHQLAHRLGSALDQSPYSHSNMVFSNRMSASSWADGGVDIREVEYDLALWDFWTLPDALEPAAHAYYARRRGTPYDRNGVLRFALPIFKECQDHDFCHEVNASALGFSEPWRYGPGLLLANCRDRFGSVQCDGPWPTSISLHPAVKEAILKA